MSTLVEQVRTALEQFTAAHEDAERRIAAAATLKLSVGGNEADRKRQAASMPADEYAGYVASLTEAEREKAAAVATAERREKELNVLRELLNHEAETIGRGTAEIQMDVAKFHHATMELAEQLAKAQLDQAKQQADRIISNASAAIDARARHKPKPTAVDDSNVPF